MLLLFAGIDHDEDPVLTLPVFLPSLILLLGAGMYLRSATKASRALAMFISLTPATIIRISDGKIFYGLIVIPMGMIVFVPALLELLPSDRGSVQSL